jgi:hypothetical protein
MSRRRNDAEAMVRNVEKIVTEYKNTSVYQLVRAIKRIAACARGADLPNTGEAIDDFADFLTEAVEDDDPKRTTLAQLETTVIDQGTPYEELWLDPNTVAEQLLNLRNTATHEALALLYHNLK